MKMLTSVVAGVAVAAGSLGATVAFRAAADTQVATTTPKAAAPAASPRVPHVKPVKVLRFRPCPPGTERAGDHCVRHVVHTVVVTDPPAPAPAPPAPAAPPVPAPPPAPATTQARSAGHAAAGRTHGDDRTRDGAEHGSEPGGDD